MSTRWHETRVTLEVPFHDVDPLGVVWHGHYYKYLEVARCRLLGGLDLDGDELIETGYRFYVIESRCRYAYPLRFRDRVEVVAWIREHENRIVVAYEVHNLTAKRRAARAHTILAVTDADGALQMETPDVVRARLGA